MELDALSDREREVLDLALAGLSGREIAERLTLTEATIRSHLARIYAKLGVSSRVELMAKLKPAPVVERPQRPEEAGTSRLPHRSRRVLLAVAAASLALVAGARILGLPPGPTPTTVDHISQMLAQGQLTSVDYRNGTTLFVEAKDGGSYRVDDVDSSVWPRLLGQARSEGLDTGFTAEGGTPESPWVTAIVIGSIVGEIAVIVLLVALALAALRWILRSTPPRRPT